MSIFGKIYKGPPVEDLNVADILNVSNRRPGQAVDADTTEATKLDDPQFNQSIRESISRREDWFYDRDGPQPPVTEAESEEITRQVENAREELRQLEAYVQGVQDMVERQIADSAVAGQEVAIQLRTKNNFALKKAIRKLFGETKDRITLSDYKALLQARSQMEKEAAVDYAKGFPE